MNNETYIPSGTKSGTSHINYDMNRSLDGGENSIKQLIYN